MEIELPFASDIQERVHKVGEATVVEWCRLFRIDGYWHRCDVKARCGTEKFWLCDLRQPALHWITYAPRRDLTVSTMWALAGHLPVELVWGVVALAFWGD